VDGELGDHMDMIIVSWMFSVLFYFSFPQVLVCY